MYCWSSNNRTLLQLCGGHWYSDFVYHIYCHSVSQSYSTVLVHHVFWCGNLIIYVIVQLDQRYNITLFCYRITVSWFCLFQYQKKFCYRVIFFVFFQYCHLQHCGTVEYSTLLPQCWVLNTVRQCINIKFDCIMTH